MQHAEKITVTIPFELKEQLVALKDDLKTSMSAIYKEAIEVYLERKEVEKWERGAMLASKNQEYINQSKEIGSEGGELHEY